MKRVFLTSGPRGSGKSTYVKKVLENRTELVIISRDEIAISLFGSIYLNPYTGDHDYLLEIVFDRVAKILRENKDVTIVLDYWNGYPRERESIISKLRELGADEVYCLYFEISSATCVEWFKKKLDAGNLSESSIRSDCELYYNLSRNIHEDGFDKVFTINPLQGELEYGLSIPFLIDRKK